MARHLSLLYSFIGLLLLVSCKQEKVKLKSGDLYGKWKYIKVENPYSHPPDSVKNEELQVQKPYILFSKDSLQIWWGGGILSRGSYKVEGDSIRFTEIMTDGKTREFPFIVTKLAGKYLVFETSGEDGSRVTAVKE
ncbi:hypothetical protein [Mucilaginibacter sp.]|jgi:hypothetical protein|uniref:hypothetical protein n=1 Tax=Mucilaginibacter sp. TaxID=1882438 RepID=UPI002BC6108E|nr:hypothetical protein [Mucilaginibacter sp.]HTI58268.1 hypothetical protein [Mucilaginibacter sp.]